MSNDEQRKPRRAPGRFVTTKEIVEKRKPVSPVAKTKMKRYDRKEVMDWDMERQRAEARARLLSRGFDVPEILQPRRPEADPDDPEVSTIDPDAGRDISGAAMAGPKPAAPKKSRPITAGDLHNAAKQGDRPKPNRHFLASNIALQARPNAAQAETAQNDGQGRDDSEGSAYREYLEGLGEGAKTGLDIHNDITGRVDDLKSASKTGSGNIDLPDNSSSWVSQEEARRRNVTRESQAHSVKRKSARQAKAEKKARARGNALALDKVLPKLGAYMVAAIAVGYVLVLVYTELGKLIGG
ncbi:hypothetical protein ACFOY8_04770 [Thalassospira xianhensis]|uniref:Uncharacterized protein n=1 Tax=Thalassospira xianhensis MCCC 1A02616 TaxID=1177929 RepID=A0A367UE54_9PROT|nr:hypothetical protein [Thalassospira xianhensis]RCK05584.1 hypothetical protein TH5_13150 [Thalassospira xianhensis MCCC 1A02616]